MEISGGVRLGDMSTLIQSNNGKKVQTLNERQPSFRFSEKAFPSLNELVLRDDQQSLKGAGPTLKYDMSWSEKVSETMKKKMIESLKKPSSAYHTDIVKKTHYKKIQEMSASSKYPKTTS